MRPLRIALEIGPIGRRRIRGPVSARSSPRGVPPRSPAPAWPGDPRDRRRGNPGNLASCRGSRREIGVLRSEIARSASLRIEADLSSLAVARWSIGAALEDDDRRLDIASVPRHRGALGVSFTRSRARSNSRRAQSAVAHHFRQGLGIGPVGPLLSGATVPGAVLKATSAFGSGSTSARPPASG